jgi:bacterioferritin-associated ferredoxin
MHANCYLGNCGDCRGNFVCHCLKVTEEALLEVLRSGSIRSVRELREQTGAGDGCTACHARLRTYIERHALELVEETAAVA